MSQTPVPTPIGTASPGAIPFSRADLPLACPGRSETLWTMPPRVYLPIEDEPDGEAMCPYCGARYRLSD